MTEGKTLCIVVDPSQPRFKQVGLLIQAGEAACRIKFSDGEEVNVGVKLEFPGQLPRVCFFEARDACYFFEAILNILPGSAENDKLDLLASVRTLAEQPVNACVLYPKKMIDAARETFLDLVCERRA